MKELRKNHAVTLPLTVTVSFWAPSQGRIWTELSTRVSLYLLGLLLDPEEGGFTFF
jgi:hypothetical protein